MRWIGVTALTLIAFIWQAPQPRPVEERIAVGAFDPASIQGLTFVTGTSTSPGLNYFGLRLLVYRPQSAVEEIPRRVVLGPQAPDGSYSSLTWYSSFDGATPITLKWSRLQPHLVVGRVTAPSNVRVALEVYSPWASQVSWANFWARPDRTTLLGEQIHTRTGVFPRRRFLLRTDRTAIGAASYRDAAAFRELLSKEGHAQPFESEATLAPYRQAALSFDLAQETAFSFVATVGDQWESMEQEAQTVLQKPPIEWLDQAEKRYLAGRPGSAGALGDSFDQVSHLLEWNRYFDPGKQSFYLASSRHPGEWSPGSSSATETGSESFFLAMMGSLIDPSSATATIRQILEGQLTDGRIPPRRGISAAGTTWLPAGRSLPPIGAWCALKIYLATNDLEFLVWAYPRLLLWNDWWHYNRGDGQAWRDGNGDGLLEWGFNEQLEFGALGRQQLSPEARKSLALTESGFAGGDQEAIFNERTETIEVNSVGLNALYALDTESLATIARELGLALEADRLQDRYQRLRKLINDKLWDEELGLYVDRRWDGRISRPQTLENFYPLLAGLPEPDRVQRMATALRGKEKAGESQPIMNYLVYQGLRRYGRHEEAAALAQQGLARDRTAFDLSSSLSLWPAFEELLCTDPGSGINIGSPVAREEARLERIPLAGGRLDVILGPKRTVVRRNGKIELECEAPVRLRYYRKQDRTFGFSIETADQVRVLSPGEEGKKTTVSVDNKILGSTSVGAAASFKVPPGIHRVLIVR